MKPYYHDTAVTIYHGDCREIVPSLGKFDLLLTDPPYGLAEKSNGGSWGNFGSWDNSPPPPWTLGMMMEKARRQIMWGGNYYQLPPSRGWLIWRKPLLPSCADAEMAWTNMDMNTRVFDESRNPDGKRDHPTQKPVSLMRWCLDQVPDAKTVLDPWMGSGTTLVAARAKGLRAVGIEINEQYCKAAVARLSQGVLLAC